MRVPSTLLAAVAVAALAVGCTAQSDEDDRVPLTGNVPEEGAVDVGLDDYVVNADTSEAPAGEVTFIASNQGQVPHELQVARFESAEDVPTADDGAVDEDELGDALLDATEELARGDSEELTVTLDEGAYVLFCNVDDHFARGMVASFNAEPDETESTTTTAAA